MFGIVIRDGRNCINRGKNQNWQANHKYEVVEFSSGWAKVGDGFNEHLAFSNDFDVLTQGDFLVRRDEDVGNDFFVCEVVETFSVKMENQCRGLVDGLVRVDAVVGEDE